MGYRFNRVNFFLKSTVILTNGTEEITVAMALDAIGYALNIIATYDTSVNKYRSAITVLKAMKLLLENNSPKKPSKKEFELTVDVIEEISNMQADNDEIKKKNAQIALICKLVIDNGWGQNNG